MLEQFDDNALEIIKKSFEYTTKNFKLNKVGTESFLYVMFTEEDSICNFLLEDYRVKEEEITEIISKYIIIRDYSSEYTEKFLEVMEVAKKFAKESKSNTVREEHLLYALLIVKDTIFMDEISKLNLNPLNLLEDLKVYFSFKNSFDIDSYSISLTELAKNKKLNKMIGRYEYLERMKIVLNRKNKNNILLIGSAGVGKTALVEGLCYELLERGMDYNVISLNISSLIANTKYRGDFEARINKVLQEVIDSENAILFIDEIHTIMGAGSSDNLLDVANIIKPYLVRNNFRCIGATTAEEYQKTIIKDKALARRFQPIFVNELNNEETLEVLCGIKDDYISFHKVGLDENSFKYIIKICEDKMLSRKFPDKAIDLLDEAMCIAKTKGDSELKIKHIDEAFKNITGALVGILDYNYKYIELQPYFLDNYLSIKENKNLLSVVFDGDENNLKLLINEIKMGFGITREMILELDMSSYSDSSSLSSLIGSSPGYIGYDEGGIISEHFSKYPYQFLIIHNLEKASPEIKEFILTLKEKGFFYDKKGREYKTNNTVFLFAQKSLDESSIGFIKQNSKRKNIIDCDLYLSNIIDDLICDNPYISTLKLKGFELFFDYDDFSKYKSDFKKSFVVLLNEYERGKYQLEYDNNEKKIQIVTLA